MRRAISLQPRADADIDYYFFFLYEENVDAAVRFLAAVSETIEDIAEMPEVGRRREFDRAPDRSVWMRQVRGFRNYIIFYTLPDDATVKVLRVLHGAMDVETILADETE